MKDKLNLASSTDDPLTKDGPAPADNETEAAQPGPDRINIEVIDPDDKPCFVHIPKVFPLSGGYTIPKTADPIQVKTTTSLKPLFTDNSNDNPTLQQTEEFAFWYETMQYGIINLDNMSIHAKDTLFVYNTLEKSQFTLPIHPTSKAAKTRVRGKYQHPIVPIHNTKSSGFCIKIFRFPP
jgi:hypothetical protein